jgi:hypothetical protein
VQQFTFVLTVEATHEEDAYPALRKVIDKGHLEFHAELVDTEPLPPCQRPLVIQEMIDSGRKGLPCVEQAMRTQAVA